MKLSMKNITSLLKKLHFEDFDEVIASKSIIQQLKSGKIVVRVGSDIKPTFNSKISRKIIIEKYELLSDYRKYQIQHIFDKNKIHALLYLLAVILYLNNAEKLFTRLYIKFKNNTLSTKYFAIEWNA